MSEALLAHEGAYKRASLGTEGQWVTLLLHLIQWLYLVNQVVRWEVVQLVRRLSVAEHYYERTIEELRAVDFDLIGECVSWELCYVSFEIQNMKA